MCINFEKTIRQKLIYIAQIAKQKAYAGQKSAAIIKEFLNELRLLRINYSRELDMILPTSKALNSALILQAALDCVEAVVQEFQKEQPIEQFFKKIIAIKNLYWKNLRVACGELEETDLLEKVKLAILILEGLYLSLTLSQNPAISDGTRAEVLNNFASYFNLLKNNPDNNTFH